LTPELKDHLKKIGISNPNIVQNPTISCLYEWAMQPEHRTSAGDETVYESTITDTGALCVSSGKKTGRVPKEKRIVLDEVTKDEIWWGDVNIPQSPIGYARNRTKAIDSMNQAPRLFVIDGYAGWDPKYQKKARIICTRPYHAMFMKQMLMRDSKSRLMEQFITGPDFTVINGGEYAADP